MEDNNQTQDSKGAWMERLAMESWQAEMVISGVAIFGSFQLFDILNGLSSWFYFNLPEGFMGIAYFLCFYLLVAVAVLVMSFLAHFILRALWIAAIGLESVYPNGIRRENDSYSTHFMDQLMEKFPSLNQFNQDLDRVASALLAYALSFVMVFIGIGILLSALVLIGFVLAAFIDDDLASNIIKGIFGVLAFLLMFNAFLNSKSLREKEWVKRIQFPLTMFLGGTMAANIFAKPQTYFGYTIRTNLGTKRFWGLMMGVLIGVLVISVSVFSRTQILALMPSQYLRYDDRTDRMYSTNYADESFEYHLSFIRPQIPSATIKDLTELELFIPMPERESRKLFNRCSGTKPERTFAPDELEAYFEATRQYRQDCFREQLRILLDDVTVDYILKAYRHPHAQEPGLRLFFPFLVLEPGEHNLTIEHLAVDNSGQPKVDRIPFFYLPGKY